MALPQISPRLFSSQKNKTPGRLLHFGCDCGSTICQQLHQRVMNDMTRRTFLGGMSLMLGAFSSVMPMGVAASPKGAATPRPILFTNLRLFDGSGQKPVTNLHVLVEGSYIKALLAPSEKVADAMIIDCGGKLLMPGLIDAHWHSMLAGINQLRAMTSDVGYMYLTAAHEAQKTLLRGFTSVRDAGGPAFALKAAIDEGMVEGPRIFPSGAMISQTSGHGDFRLLNELPRGSQNDLSFTEHAGVAMIADGDALVLRRVREQLMHGASQIKMLAGGGVASMYDPIDSTQFTEAELRAGVAAADDWNTYVMTHVYTPKGIQRAIQCGVKCIEHGQLADEATVRMMQSEGTWWSLQPFLQDEDSNIYPSQEQRAAQKRVSEGTVRAYELAQKYGINTGWGTDILFNAKNTATQGKQLAKLTRFYDPLTVLAQGTQKNGELLALSGERNPYKGAALGQITTGAYADLIIADGDPTLNLDFIANPADNFHLIMKNGKIYKNTLS